MSLLAKYRAQRVRKRSLANLKPAAEGQCKAAIRGKTDAEIREVLEGKTPAAIGDGGESMSVMLNVDAVRKNCAKWSR